MPSSGLGGSINGTPENGVHLLTAMPKMTRKTAELDGDGVDLDSRGSSSRSAYWFAIALLSLGWVMIYADRLSISPLMNLIQREFGLSFSAVSSLFSIYFFT
jgi:hypothetical protein